MSEGSRSDCAGHRVPLLLPAGNAPLERNVLTIAAAISTAPIIASGVLVDHDRSVLRTIDVVHLRAVAAALPTRVEAVSWQWCVPADALRMQCAMIDPALLDKSIWPIVRVANHWLVQGNIRVPLHALAMKDLEANLRNTLRAAAFVGVTACDAKPWMLLLLRQLLSPPATRSSGRPSRAMQHNVMVARTLMDQLEIALSSTANDSYVCHGVLLALLLMLLQMRPLVTKHVVVVQSYWRQHCMRSTRPGAL